MKRSEDALMTVVRIIPDGVTMSEAALEGDWDEARFRCRLVVDEAAACGLMEAGVAAASLADLWGLSAPSRAQATVPQCWQFPPSSMPSVSQVNRAAKPGTFPSYGPPSRS